MDRIDPSRLSDLILSAPGWARVGIAMPDPRIRARAADALASAIVERLEDAPPAPIDQMALPL